MTDRDEVPLNVEQCARVLEEFFASQCVGHADCKLPHEELDRVINLARKHNRAKTVVPVTREALFAALPFHGTEPQARWVLDEIHAALVRLGVAKE